MIQILAPTVIARGLFKFNQLPKIIPLQQFCLNIIEVWTSYILQHTPLLISDGLYQQLNYSLHLDTSLAFIGTVEDLERSVTLQ